MIIEWLIGVFSSVASTVFGWIPDWTLPDWYGPTLDAYTATLAVVADLNLWIPLTAIAQGALLIATATGVTIVIRFLRIGLSLFTGGGGSAA